MGRTRVKKMPGCNMSNYEIKRFRVDVSYILLHFGFEPLGGVDKNIPPTRGVIKMLEGVPVADPKQRKKLDLPKINEKLKEIEGSGSVMDESEEEFFKGLRTYLDKCEMVVSSCKRLEELKEKRKKEGKGKEKEKEGENKNENKNKNKIESEDESHIVNSVSSWNKVKFDQRAKKPLNQMNKLNINCMEQFMLKYVPSEYKIFKPYDIEFPKLRPYLEAKRKGVNELNGGQYRMANRPYFEVNKSDGGGQEEMKRNYKETLLCVSERKKEVIFAQSREFIARSFLGTLNWKIKSKENPSLNDEILKLKSLNESNNPNSKEKKVEKVREAIGQCKKSMADQKENIQVIEKACKLTSKYKRSNLKGLLNKCRLNDCPLDPEDEYCFSVGGKDSLFDRLSEKLKYRNNFYSVLSGMEEELNRELPEKGSSRKSEVVQPVQDHKIFGKSDMKEFEILVDGNKIKGWDALGYTSLLSKKEKEKREKSNEAENRKENTGGPNKQANTRLFFKGLVRFKLNKRKKVKAGSIDPYEERVEKAIKKNNKKKNSKGKSSKKEEKMIKKMAEKMNKNKNKNTPVFTKLTGEIPEELKGQVKEKKYSLISEGYKIKNPLSSKSRIKAVGNVLDKFSVDVSSVGQKMIECFSQILGNFTFKLQEITKKLITNKCSINEESFDSYLLKEVTRLESGSTPGSEKAYLIDRLKEAEIEIIKELYRENNICFSKEISNTESAELPWYEVRSVSEECIIRLSKSEVLIEEL